VILWLLLVQSIFAQKIEFEHLTTDNGLSQNSVLAIAQDSRGFMWYGTRVGVNRYDGHVFRHYKTDPTRANGLTGNYILSLFNDSHKTLWAGTSNGLNRYNPQKDSFERMPESVPGVSSNSINCLYEDKKGSLWVGTSDGLYQLVDRNRNLFKAYLTKENSANVRAVLSDKNGTVWVGTSKGLIKMTPGKKGYTSRWFLHDPADPGSISDSYVTTIEEDSGYTIWVGTLNGGLCRFNEQTGTFTRFSHAVGNTSGIIHNNIRKIQLDNKGMLWVGTQEGLSIFDPAKLTAVAYRHDAGNRKSLNKNSIYSVFQDSYGSMWVGTYYGGVNVSYSHQTNFTVYQNNPNHSSISDDVVSSIVEEPSVNPLSPNLWIGTEGGGLNYFDRAKGHFTAYKHNPEDPESIGSNLVKVVYRDRRGGIWAGTHGGGLNFLDPARKHFRQFLFKAGDAASLNSEVLAVLEDHQGRMWVGTQSGVKLFKNTQPPLEPIADSLIQNPIRYYSVKEIIEDKENNIWIGTSAGVYLKKHDSNRLEFCEKIRLNTTTIMCLFEDAKGRIWVGAYQGGVGVYDKKTDTFETFTEKDGLANDDVAGILEDKKGYVWISTGNGLSRLNPSTKTFITYTMGDGLAGNEFNYKSALKSSSGEFFFGSYQGLTSFVPEQISLGKHLTPIVFTTLRLFNKPVVAGDKDKLLVHDISLTNTLTFHHDQNVFSLDFALLNFIKSNKNKYAYKLEGFDQSWNNVSVPSVTYTNLPAGSYTLWVKGANNDGVWSAPISLQIAVLPPFWKTWWAYCLYAVATAALIFFVVRFFFLRELLKRDEELHQNKLNFFTNVSHEIRTHLSLIIGPVEKLILQNKEDPEISKQLLPVKRNADRLLKLVTELMDFRKAETGHTQFYISKENVVLFLKDIFTSFQTLAISREVKMEFLSEKENIDLYFDREQLGKVFINLLSNSHKFTPEGGHITLVVREEKEYAEIKVTDNGKGISPENLDKLFVNFYQENDYGIQNTGYGIGLALSKSIVELHKGSLEVESGVVINESGEKEIRTCFTVKLLKGMEHLDGDLIRPESRRPAAPFEPDLAQQPILASSAGPSASRVHTVLVVEDNDEVRAFLRESFAEHYHVVESVNGQKGWEMAIEIIPDLIISDVMMPEMDGFALCIKLKTDERTSHIPVILLTAQTSTTHQISGLERGADVYLTKPFSLKIIELHIRNLLSSREKMRHRFAQLMVRVPKDAGMSVIEDPFLKKVIQIVETHLDRPDFDVQMLSMEVGMSMSVLYKKLKALTDMSVNDFVKSIRLKKAAQLLQQNNLTIYEVAYTVGYTDRKYFSKEFKKQFGKAPSEYAADHAELLP
jgi:ligand-binding sensor domain-containing protein/signal transduction histidine kinase/DNA-binding response OmpR family regulator